MVGLNKIVAAPAATLMVLALGCTQGGPGVTARIAARPPAIPSSSAVPVETSAPTPESTPAPATAPPAPPPATPARHVAVTPPAAPPPAAPQTAGAAAWGLWEPSWQGHGDSVDFGQYTRMDAQLGHRAGFVHWFANWDEGWDYDGPLVQQVMGANRTPMITWEAYNRPLKAIAAGQYDGYIDSWAHGMAASGSRPIYLRIFHEFNDPLQPGTGSGYSWGTGGGTQNQPADLVAAWRHIHDRFAGAGASNVRFVWCPDGVNIDIGGLRAAYPGDAYVDFAGWDAYDYDTARDYQVLSQISQRPFVLPEVGSADPAWVQDLSSKLRSGGYSRIRAVIWFDEAEWRLDVKPGVRSAVKDMLTTFA
jgi:mannan endo-1,4-beta-mannosidase